MSVKLNKGEDSIYVVMCAHRRRTSLMLTKMRSRKSLTRCYRYSTKTNLCSLLEISTVILLRALEVFMAVLVLDSKNDRVPMLKAAQAILAVTNTYFKRESHLATYVSGMYRTSGLHRSAKRFQSGRWQQHKTEVSKIK